MASEACRSLTCNLAGPALAEPSSPEQDRGAYAAPIAALISWPAPTQFEQNDHKDLHRAHLYAGPVHQSWRHTDSAARGGALSAHTAFLLTRKEPGDNENDDSICLLCGALRKKRGPKPLALSAESSASAAAGSTSSAFAVLYGPLCCGRASRSFSFVFRTDRTDRLQANLLEPLCTGPRVGAMLWIFVFVQEGMVKLLLTLLGKDVVRRQRL